MTKRRTLLADLGAKLDGKQENLATEALGFILSESLAARKAFNRLLLGSLGPSEPEISLSWATQEHVSESTIPDMIGKDESGNPKLFVEAKFWAGLTDRQPVEYLERLKVAGGLGLVFIAPVNRLAMLWHELDIRCTSAMMPSSGEDRSEFREYRRRFDNHPTLAAVSWDAVLTVLEHATTDSHEFGAFEDVRQLRGLCDLMEETGFLPLTSEELTGAWARRMNDFCGLVGATTDALLTAGVGTTKGLKQSSGSNYYGQYLLLKGNPAQISFHWGCWLKYGRTPMWLRIYGQNWKPPLRLPEGLAKRLRGDVPDAFKDEERSVWFPLLVPFGKEEQQVVASLKAQVVAVYELLDPGQTITSPPVELQKDP